MSRVVTWDDIAASEVYPGITRQEVVSNGSTLVRYTYLPGCAFPVHQHPEEQITVIHSGQIEFVVAGIMLVLHAGQVAVIPGGVPHGARVTANEIVVTDNYVASANRSPLSMSESNASYS